MGSSGIVNVKTLSNMGGDGTAPLPAHTMSVEDRERLIVLGKGAAELAHQLNNSFDGIRRFLHLSLAFADADNTEKATHYVLKAQGVLEKMGNMAESLLHFARSEGTHPDGPTMLHRMLEDIIQLYEHRIKAHRVELKTSWEANDHILIPGDFYHVFLNLTRNAIDAMPDGGELRMLTHRENGRVNVAISDSGDGVPEHMRDKLFKPFFTTKEKGTGLGLALSKEIVERYGGIIYCESRDGKGSTFTVTIPING